MSGGKRKRSIVTYGKQSTSRSTFWQRDSSPDDKEEIAVGPNHINNRHEDDNAGPRKEDGGSVRSGVVQLATETSGSSSCSSALSLPTPTLLRSKIPVHLASTASAAPKLRPTLDLWWARQQREARHSTLSAIPRPLPPMASMTSEPRAEDVQMVATCIGSDDATARKYLRAKQNNVESAVNAFWEGENIDTASAWDENVWGADRDGTGTNLQPLGASGAPTRGNSPVPSLGISGPRTKEAEEAQLQEVLALSSQQQSGVVRADGTEVKHFGPATKENYANGQWAMVLSAANVSEVVPDVNVLHRENVPGEPRLLQHLADGDYTPNLLTILHTIPGARDALLLHDMVRADYGEDGEWWRGHSIPMPRIVTLVDSQPAQPDNDEFDELIAEVQRIMAFLEGSSRSYATIGALTQTEAIKSYNPVNSDSSATLMELFLEKWTLAAATRTELGRRAAARFTTTVGAKGPDAMDTPDLRIINLTVPAGENQKTDVVELLDNLIWNTDPDEPDATDNFVDHPADILIMRVINARPGAQQVNAEVPAELFMDKYLEGNIDASRSTRQEITRAKRALAVLEEMEERLLWHPHPRITGEKVLAVEMMNHTYGHFSGSNHADEEKSEEVNGTTASNGTPPAYAGIVTKLDEVMLWINESLAKLAAAKETARKRITETSKATPKGLQSDLSYRYTLRGVATKPHVTYVLRPKDAPPAAGAGDEDYGMGLQPPPSAQLADADADDTTPPGMQWWRLDYDTSSSAQAQISKTLACDYDVLRAAELEHNSTLLVYTSSRAGDSTRYATALPPALQDFVERDNALFAAEMAAESAGPPAYAAELGEVRPSIEPRGSPDSTRVEGGYSPPSQGVDDFLLGQEEEEMVGYGGGADMARDVKVSAHAARVVDPEPVEIRLDEVGDSGAEIAMEERAPQVVPAGSRRGYRHDDGDTPMGGAESQD